MSMFSKKAFTLIELLVVVLIIGVLAAVAVPQYQRAVLKSRFTALMPIGKTLANANEAYYLQHLEYASAPADLPVEGQAQYPDGTAILLYPGTDDLSFVRVKNETDVPNAQYVVYQKHSKNFPDTTWCEAGDTRAEAMCAALGGVIPNGITGNSSGTDGWKAYLLSGQVREGDSFAENGNNGSGASNPSGVEPAVPSCPENFACDSTGAVIGCAPGYYSDSDSCVEQPIVSTSCSADNSYCANKNYAGEGARCDGYGNAKGCSGSTFSGNGAVCLSQSSYSMNCQNTTYTGLDSSCIGGHAWGCSNSTFYGGSYCRVGYPGSCSQTTYLPNEEGVLGCCMPGAYSCPQGVPLCEREGTHYVPSGWVGGCCNPAAVGGSENCGSTPKCS